MATHTELRSRQIAGLLILAAFILIAAIVRADKSNLLPHGWWHVW